MHDKLESRECARYLRALADPERLKIVQCLQSGPKNVGEISTLLEQELANVSHHLGVLRHAGLVQDAKDGKFVIYRLHPDARSRLTTAYMSAYFLGGVLCSSVTGALYASDGWGAVCVFGGCVSLFGLAAYNRRRGVASLGPLVPATSWYSRRKYVMSIAKVPPRR